MYTVKNLTQVSVQIICCMVISISVGCTRNKGSAYEDTGAIHKISVATQLINYVKSDSDIPTQQEIIDNGQNIYITPEFIIDHPDAWITSRNIYSAFYLTDTDFYPDSKYISLLGRCIPDAMVLRCTSPSIDFAWYLTICTQSPEIPVSAQGATFNISQVFPKDSEISLLKVEYSCGEYSITFNKDELNLTDCRQIGTNSFEITIPPNPSPVEKEWLVTWNCTFTAQSEDASESHDGITRKLNLPFVQQAGEPNTANEK